nr:50S ribosome-binding GTPase [Lachnospiraceae bacterium]
MSSAIALLGQPNSGKSTLFNALTGAHQHVGNWPGKTVEKNEGSFDYEGKKIKVIDLPGTYSLAANSDEEIVTRDYIAGQEADTVCILADSSQLERSLFMLADYAGIRVPALLLLNMMDVAKVQGKNIDTKKISKKLGISVIPFVAQDKKNYDEFYSLVSENRKDYPDYSLLEEEYKKEFGETYADVCHVLPENGIGVYSPCWLFAKLVEKDPVAMQMVEEKIGSGKYSELNKILSGIKDGSSRTGSCKFAWIDAILEGSVKDGGSGLFRSKFDRIATSKRWGKPLAIAIMLGALILSIIFGIPFMMLGSYIPGLAAPVADALL